MFRFIKPNIMKKLNHTHSKTIFPENNKDIEYLIREQNKILQEISYNSDGIVLMLGFLNAIIASCKMLG